MASIFGVESRQSASSFSSQAYIYPPSRSSSPKPAAAAAEPSPVKFQMNRRSASPSSSNAAPSNMKKAVCMCSPTTHPGSFRCSLHRNSKNSVNSANRSQFRNESLKSSLARVGGDVGADLAKRALSATIRHSSHQQRRRSAFQARPSRLSVMSRAEDHQD